MSIVEAISIPSTASLNDVAQRLSTPQEIRERRARETGLTIVTCPLCGEQATQEVLLATRPGQGTVRRTVVRCLRKNNTPRCPASVSEEAADDPGRPEHHPDQQNATEARPGPKEEHMPERTCAECGADISTRGIRARWCVACARVRAFEQQRDWKARNRAAVKADSPRYVQRDVPLALRVSVLDLTQRLAQGPEVRAVVRAVLALSPKRQDLLRRLLEDEEATA
jgi:hypothetical protein